MGSNTSISDHCRDAMGCALRLLSRRDHARAEISDKLKMRGFSSEAVSKVLNECQRLGYIDDSRFAGLFAKRLWAKGYGPNYIRREMKRLQLDADLIDQVLAPLAHDSCQLEHARSILRKRLQRQKKGQSPRKTRERLHRFLLARGFSKHVVICLANEEIP